MKSETRTVTMIEGIKRKIGKTGLQKDVEMIMSQWRRNRLARKSPALRSIQRRAGVKGMLMAEPVHENLSLTACHKVSLKCERDMKSIWTSRYIVTKTEGNTSRWEQPTRTEIKTPNSAPNQIRGAQKIWYQTRHIFQTGQQLPPRLRRRYRTNLNTVTGRISKHVMSYQSQKEWPSVWWTKAELKDLW